MSILEQRCRARSCGLGQPGIEDGRARVAAGPSVAPRIEYRVFNRLAGTATDGIVEDVELRAELTHPHALERCRAGVGAERHRIRDLGEGCAAVYRFIDIDPAAKTGTIDKAVEVRAEDIGAEAIIGVDYGFLAADRGK